MKTQRHSDTDVLARVIGSIRKEDSAVETLHSDYMYMASLQMRRIEARKDLESYYRLACSEPVAKMRRSIEQGMIK